MDLLDGGGKVVEVGTLITHSLTHKQRDLSARSSSTRLLPLTLVTDIHHLSLKDDQVWVPNSCNPMPTVSFFRTVSKFTALA
eukprot:m.49277 g.49277  ORF g.49277 m.49277 type:complete len:82 (-) comp16066_c1_seq2:122-367(-)